VKANWDAFDAVNRAVDRTVHWAVNDAVYWPVDGAGAVDGAVYADVNQALSGFIYRNTNMTVLWAVYWAVEAGRDGPKAPDMGAKHGIQLVALTNFLSDADRGAP